MGQTTIARRVVCIIDLSVDVRGDHVGVLKRLSLEVSAGELFEVLTRQSDFGNCSEANLGEK